MSPVVASPCSLLRVGRVVESPGCTLQRFVVVSLATRCRRENYRRRQYPLLHLALDPLLLGQLRRGSFLGSS